MKLLSLFLAPLALFAQEVTPTSPGGGISQTLIMIGVALVFFYFILWRPEQKRRKAAETLRSALKKGDRVTAMAIIGTIDRVGENTVVLKMIDGAKIEMLKASITDVQSANEAATPEA
jgi:preprotein translocase subunit YajC